MLFIKKTKTMSSAKQLWIDAGFAILCEHGDQALTIDRLAQRLARTKGSFYHHFGNWEGYAHALLTAWEEEGTHRIIRLTEEADSAEAKLQRLSALTTQAREDERTFKLDGAIRAWALRDPIAHAYQARIDTTRRDYCCALVTPFCDDPETAETLGVLAYTLYVGAQQIVPPLPTPMLKRLDAHLFATLFQPPASHS